MATSDISIANGALLRLGADGISSLGEANDRARLVNQHFVTSRKESLREHPWNFAVKRTRLSANEQVSVAFSAASGTVTINVGGNVLEAGRDESSRIMLGDGGIVRIATVSAPNAATGTVEGNPLLSLNHAANTWRIAPVWGWEFRYPKPTGWLRLVEAEQPAGVSGITALWSWWRDLGRTPEPVSLEGDFVVSNTGPTLDVQYIQDISDVTKWDALFDQVMETHLAFKIAYGVTGSLQKERTAFDGWKIALASARTVNAQEKSEDDAYPHDLTDFRV